MIFVVPGQGPTAWKTSLGVVRVQCLDPALTTPPPLRFASVNDVLLMQIEWSWGCWEGSAVFEGRVSGEAPPWLLHPSR